MNLQKYTKAELISKFKQLQNKNNNYKDWFNILLNYIRLFKSFILKITLISLLIKLFKKYSLFRKILAIINYSILTLFGISITDIYASQFIINLVDLWRNSQIYIWISHLFGYKIENVKEIPSRMKQIDISSTTNSKTSEENNRIIEWFDKIRNKQPEIIEDNNDNLKYYIIYGLIITVSACFIYTYWDDITPYAISIWNLFRRRGDRPGDSGSGIGGDNPSNNNQPSESVIPTNAEERSYWGNFKHKFELWRRGNPENYNTNNPISVLNQVIEEDVQLEDNAPIEGVSSEFTQYFKEEPKLDKGKGVLTSPSLENLNSEVKESWSESGTSSPGSSDSTETIKPIDPKTITEQSQSTSSTTNQNVNIINESGGSIKSILNISELQNPITADNFEKCLSLDIQDNIVFIENAFGNTVISKEEALTSVDKIVKLSFSYDELVNYYNNNCSKLSIIKVRKLKELTFYMRQWLVDYNSRLNPDIKFNIDIGTIEDNPKLIAKIVSEQILANH